LATGQSSSNMRDCSPSSSHPACAYFVHRSTDRTAQLHSLDLGSVSRRLSDHNEIFSSPSVACCPCLFSILPMCAAAFTHARSTLCRARAHSGTCASAPFGNFKSCTQKVQNFLLCKFSVLREFQSNSQQFRCYNLCLFLGVKKPDLLYRRSLTAGTETWSFCTCTLKVYCQLTTFWSHVTKHRVRVHKFCPPKAPEYGPVVLDKTTAAHQRSSTSY
jgi:hypothetical protein